ncbi:MAG: HEAT repeat domain-containing protein, partial [Planctomycetes bacterium]|nr:HEAT repeat domain-containing protein [Planctomycetota bacterium]
MHANDWHVVRARRLLQERAAKPNWDGKTVHASLRDMLANELDASRRLRAFWTLRVTNGIDTSGLIALLGDSNEHVRSWAIQLLCENQKPPASAVEKFATLAKSDPSPVVRLYLAAALQQLPLAERWNIAEGLVGHAEDTDDANLPLMYWYGIEPLMTEHGSNTVKLAAAARIP